MENTLRDCMCVWHQSPFADRVVIDRLEEACDALGPAGPGHVLGWLKAGLFSPDRVAPDLGDSSKSEK